MVDRPREVALPNDSLNSGLVQITLSTTHFSVRSPYASMWDF